MYKLKIFTKKKKEEDNRALHFFRLYKALLSFPFFAASWCICRLCGGFVSRLKEPNHVAIGASHGGHL